MTVIIGLLILGIILVVLEILVLPGLVAGILGGAFLLAGIIWMYAAEGDKAGNITLAATFAATCIAIYFSLKSKSWMKYGLKSSIDSRVNDIASLSIQEGAEGRTLSALRPSGTILIDGAKVEANTSGEMIDAGSKVIVTRVLPNRVIVKMKTTELQ